MKKEKMTRLMMKTQEGEIVVKDKEIDWIGSLPFLSVHAGALLVFLAGFSWIAFATFFFSFLIRMFAVTGGYHRYFSHRTYKTSRIFQFILAWIGTSAAQMGPLWWAAHHRHHHRYSDTPLDIHTPSVQGFWWSHMGWILEKKNAVTHWANVRDWARYPELCFLNKYYMIPPILFAGAMCLWGYALNALFPQLGTSAFQMLAWGFFLATTVLYHCTFTINSLAHTIGTRRFQTEDSSRNSFFLAILSLGEGWHNNHHRYPASERQGFYWWEVDITHYGLRILSWLGLVWDLNRPPKKIFDEARQLKEKKGTLETLQEKAREAREALEGQFTPELEPQRVPVVAIDSNNHRR